MSLAIHVAASLSAQGNHALAQAAILAAAAVGTPVTRPSRWARLCTVMTAPRTLRWV